MSSHTWKLLPPRLSDKLQRAGSVHDDSNMSHDYKGRPRMLSSQHGMVAADQGDCSAIGAYMQVAAFKLCSAFAEYGLLCCLHLCTPVRLEDCLAPNCLLKMCNSCM